MVFERHIIPIAFRTGHDSRKLIKLLITGDTLELLLGKQCILLILLILGDDKYNLFDFGLQEEQSFFDL